MEKIYEKELLFLEFDGNFTWRRGNFGCGKEFNII
jgi:hypothetical protein